MGVRKPTMSRIRGVNPATAHSTRGVAIGPARGVHARDASALQANSGHLGLLVDLHAAAVGPPSVAPRHGIMAGDRAGLVEQGAEDGGVASATHVDRGYAALDERGVHGFRAHSEMLVDLGAPAHGAHRRIGMGQRVMPTRRIKQVQVEIFAQVLPQSHALIVELDALRGEIVRPDDRGVPPRVSAADVALLEHRDVADPVIPRQVVRAGQAMAAGADDHDVVGRPEGSWRVNIRGSGCLRDQPKRSNR